MAVLPMFPLGSVLLPGNMLPLHVFEPRYRALVQDCVAAAADGGAAEFGVTLIERGHEVGGGDERTAWGTVARIVQVSETPDGRYAVVSIGMRRIRVNAWLPDDPYPLADVDDWPEGDCDTEQFAASVGSVTARVRSALALAVELGDSNADPGADIADEPVLASHQLASLAPIGPLDRHRLLAAASPLDRLHQLDELLVDVHTLLQFRLGTEP